jgi:hypothetical protein
VILCGRGKEEEEGESGREGITKKNKQNETLK